MEVQGLGSRRGCVPGVPFGRVITEWIERETPSLENELSIAPLVILAEWLEMDIDNLRKIKNGKRPWIGFDLADKIVSLCTDGLGWRNDSELRSIYMAFDFRWLDAKKPCTAAA